jgi:8-hydroxy-5-deazaflavin:NADPH oxidoreductase
MAGIRVAVLGAGKIGGTLGKKWAVAGHTVAFGVANPNGEKAQAVRAELGDKVAIGSVAEALAAADVVLMAVPGGAMDETITANAAELDGKTIIDAANRMGGGGSVNSFATLKAQTPNAHIYRAFNTYGWENFADTTYNDGAADLFYCGPDGESQGAVEQLITDVGLHPMRLGGVDQVDLVDSVLRLWFALASGQQMGRHLAFKVLTR